MMLLLSILKNNPWIVTGIAIFIILSGAFFYVKHSESVKDSLKAKLVIAESAYKSLENTLVEFESKVKSVITFKDYLEKEKNNSTDAESKQTEELLQINSFDQQTLNKRSKDRARCFELATGAIPQKNETNSLCQRFIK